MRIFCENIQFFDKLNELDTCLQNTSAKGALALLFTINDKFNNKNDSKRKK